MLYDTICMWSLTKPNSQKQREEWWLSGVGCQRKWGDIGQRIQIFNYKMNKFWESNVQCGDYN